MKKSTFKLFAAIVTIALVSFASNTYATKTPGTLTFNVTTGGSVCVPCTENSESANGHVLAIWIENSSNAFVKTKLLYAGERDYDLATWVAKSAKNTVDATTGATKFSHGAEAILWDGTDASGNLVDDGTYTLWVEMAWDSEGGVTSHSISFTKGTTEDNQTPTSTTYFTNMSLVWTPSTVGISNVSNAQIGIYPNPAADKLYVELGNNTTDAKVEIFNTSGLIVISNNYKNANGKLELDINTLAKGIYVVSVLKNNNLYQERLVIE